MFKAVDATGDIPAERSVHSAVIYNGSMYIFGGLGLKRSNELFEFNFETKTWALVQTTGDIPDKRSKHCAVVYKDSMYIFAGWMDTTKTNDIIKYSFDTKEWKKINAMNPPSTRSAAGACVIGDTMYMFAGIGAGKFNDFYSYSFKTKTWKQLHFKLSLMDTLPKRSSYGTFLLVNAGAEIGSRVSKETLALMKQEQFKPIKTNGKQAVIFGGLTCGQLNDVLLFDMDNSIITRIGWSTFPNAPSKRGRHSSILYKDKYLVVFGGFSMGRKVLNDLHVFDLETLEWKQVKTHGSIPKMQGHSAVEYQGSMFVFGGWEEQNYYNTLHQLELDSIVQAPETK